MQDADFEYAGFWIRFGASIIDGIIIFAITAPLLVAIYGWGYFVRVDKPLFDGFADFIISWVFPLVATVMFWVYKQATPGKMAVSARVVDARTGKSLSTGQAIGRYFAYFVSLLPFCLGFIWVAFDPRKQGWHDKLSGTVVIRPKHGGSEPVRFES